MLRAASILPLLLLTGCAWNGPRTVTRSRFDCNSYDGPAIVCERIDVRPVKACRVADFRWRHARSPLAVPCPHDGLAACPPAFATGVASEQPLDASNTSRMADDAPDVTANVPRALTNTEATPRTAESDAEAGNDPVRTSWVFEGTTADRPTRLR